jgi:hypothetical protein
MKNGLLTIIAALPLLAIIASASELSAVPAEPVAEIEYLLAHVAESDLEFVRNGKAHSPAEAVKHMRRKYEYYADDIQSAEDFIALAATKSILSGKLYLVRDADGEVPAADWLLTALAAYRTP